MQLPRQPCSRPKTTYACPSFRQSSSQPRQVVRASAPQEQPTNGQPQRQGEPKSLPSPRPDIHRPLHTALNELNSWIETRFQDALEEDALLGPCTLGKDFSKDLQQVKDDMANLLEAATRRPFRRRGVGHRRATLRTLGDIVDLVLPDAAQRAILATSELRDAVVSATVDLLLEKDSGVLQALEVALESEGMHEHADAMRQLRARGCGLVGAEVVKDVIGRLAAVFRARGDLISLALSSDLWALFRYLHSGRETRRELLAGELYVRCTAAMLCRVEMGELEVDGGSACCYEFINTARVLRINIEMHMDRKETDDMLGELGHDVQTADEKAEQRLTQLGAIAAYTLDRVLVAVRSAAASGTRLPQELQDLPRRVTVHGVIQHVGEATHTQHQAEGQRKRRELGGDVRSGEPGGLESAMLVLSGGADRSREPARARRQHVHRRRWLP